MTDKPDQPDRPDDEQNAQTTSLLARMTAAGIGEARAHEHIARGVMRVAGEPVLDPDMSVPWPAAWVVSSG